jgi:enoyl-CoA hydratase/carnithine racemase
LTIGAKEVSNDIRYCPLWEGRGAALITFNRPEKRNALNVQMMNEIEMALYEAEEDSGVMAIILTGGSKFFIPGTDIEFLLGEGEGLTPQRMYETHFRNLTGGK